MAPPGGHDSSITYIKSRRSRRRRHATHQPSVTRHASRTHATRNHALLQTDHLGFPSKGIPVQPSKPLLHKLHCGFIERPSCLRVQDSALLRTSPKLPPRVPPFDKAICIASYLAKERVVSLFHSFPYFLHNLRDRSKLLVSVYCLRDPVFLHHPSSYWVSAIFRCEHCIFVYAATLLTQAIYLRTSSSSYWLTPIIFTL